MNCYDGEQYLPEAIESVLAQTYSNWEIIFWDNQSTDRSAAIFASYKDPRLSYFFAPKHTWLYEARNYAIQRAKGEFIAFLDVDDTWLPDKLEKQILLFSDPLVGFVCGQYWIQDERKNKRWKAPQLPMPTGWVLNELLKDQFVGLLTLMVRRSALDALDYPCDPRYHIIGDLDLVVRLSIKWKLACVQAPIAVYRMHGNNETGKHNHRMIDELECWSGEMSQLESIRTSPAALLILKNYFTYRKALYKVLEADKKGAYPLFRALPWSYPKLKLLTFLLLPTVIGRKLKN